MSRYHELLNPQKCAIAFIDHQPQMLFAVASVNRQSLVNKSVFLAKASRLYGVPAVLTSIETEGFSGYVHPRLLDVFPGQEVIERTSMNAWDDPVFREAIESTGKKDIILSGLWTEACVAWAAVSMLGAGYNIYVVEDACGATSFTAQQAALSRMVQAGAVRVTALATVLEYQRDWANREHYDDLMTLLRLHAGAYGAGIEYAYTMVHHGPQSARKPQVVSKKAK